MNVGQDSGDDHDEVMSSINTTPLVDVMLVLLIIFLITIPVVSHTVPVGEPRRRCVLERDTGAGQRDAARAA
jgi:biopolymer transport protein ExbD